MSICPNCGVTLSHTERACPLCHQPVESGCSVRAYPVNRERVPASLKNAALLSFLGMLPAIQIFFQSFLQFVTDIRR